MRKQCQSCAMPLKKESDYGTDSNGVRSDKYCGLCYVDGKFTQPDFTATDMQNFVVKILNEEQHWPKFLAKWAARQIPNLERWRNK